MLTAHLQSCLAWPSLSICTTLEGQAGMKRLKTLILIGGNFGVYTFLKCTVMILI